MIVYSKGQSVTRCDCCAKHQANGDEFDPFIVDWMVGWHPITNEPVVRFFFERRMPKTPLRMHSCPECAPKIRRSMNSGDVQQLPDGPLKKAMQTALRNPENRGAVFQIHRPMASRLARA